MASQLFTVTDTSVCQHCGTRVSKNFRQVFGDNNDVAHRCLECDTERRVMRGSAAGQELPDPDPADDDSTNTANAHTPAIPDGGVR